MTIGGSTVFCIYLKMIACFHVGALTCLKRTTCDTVALAYLFNKIYREEQNDELVLFESDSTTVLNANNLK